MPQQGLSLGRDVSLDVITPNGPLRLGLVSGFESKQDSTPQRIKGIDGISRHLRFFDGWSGTFSIERQGSVIDDYFVQLEADYYAGLNEGPVTITQTIEEPDGSVSQYTFTGVVLSLGSAGNINGDSNVKQSVSFMAQRKIKKV